MVTLRGKKHLSFELQAAEGLAMDDPVPVPLKRSAQGAGLHGLVPAQGAHSLAGTGRKPGELLLLQLFTDGHARHPFRKMCQEYH